MFLLLNIFHYKRGIGTTEAERVAQEHIEMLLFGFRDDVDALGHLIWMLEVQGSTDKVVLHHHHGVNNF